MATNEDPFSSVGMETNKPNRLRKCLGEFRLPILAGCFFLLLGVLTFIYRKEVFEGLETLSHKLSDMGYTGYVIIASLLFASSFPPLFGYTTFQTLAGYTFGFSTGFLISYVSGLMGAVVCFILSRYFFHAKVNRMLSKHPNSEAVVRAVEKKGFKLFVLVRIAPHPFSVMNFLFSATNISLFHYTLGTAISLFKIALHVYVGANLTSFAKHILGEEDEQELTPEQIKIQKIRYFVIFLLCILAAGLFAYIYRIAKKAVAEANALDDEEQLGFLSHQELDEDEEEIELQAHHTVAMDTHEPRDSMSIDNWDNWGDDEDESDHEESKTPKSKLMAKHD